METYRETKILITSIPIQNRRGLRAKGLVSEFVMRDRGGIGVPCESESKVNARILRRKGGIRVCVTNLSPEVM